MALSTLSLNASAPSAMSADLQPFRLGQLTFISFVSSPKPGQMQRVPFTSWRGWTVPYPTPRALASSAPLATAAEVAKSSWRSQSWHLSDWHLWWHTAPPEHAHDGLVWSLLKCWDVALHLITPSFSRFGFAQKVLDQFYFRIRMVAFSCWRLAPWPCLSCVSSPQQCLPNNPQGLRSEQDPLEHQNPPSPT